MAAGTGVETDAARQEVAPPVVVQAAAPAGAVPPGLVEESQCTRADHSGSCHRLCNVASSSNGLLYPALLE